MKLLFEKLGLNGKETVMLLKLLELGAQPVSVVAKHVGIPRSSAYFILDKLREFRLVEEFEKAGIKYVKCIPVRNISSLLRQKERKIGETLEVLREKLPELEALESKTSIFPKARIYEGMEEVVDKYFLGLDEKLASADYCTLFDPANYAKIYPQLLEPSQGQSKKEELDPAVFEKIFPRLMVTIVNRSKEGVVRKLIVDNPVSREYKKRMDALYRERGWKNTIKLLPKTMQTAPDITVTKDTVCTMSLEDPAVAVEVYNPPLARAIGVILEEFWKTLPE